MDLNTNDGGRDGLARALLAALLGVVAILSLRSGKRVRAALAGVGALALGYAATSSSGAPAETFDVGGADEDVELRCAVCGEPIRPGQWRGPNENDEIVHDACR